MRKNNCEVIRRELDELMPNETCSAGALEHLKECAACREFHQTQTKLRQMVGSLGTVSAPADFDFRLRARLASDSTNGAFHYWSFARRGFAVAVTLIILATGVVVLRNVMKQQTPVEVTAEKNAPVPQESPKAVQQNEQKKQEAVFTAGIPASNPSRIKNERPQQTSSRVKPPLMTRDSASKGASVISGSEPAYAGTIAVFPIDASLQSFRISLDDGRGNAKTVSVPTIRFGSQRLLSNANQLAQKGVW